MIFLKLSQKVIVERQGEYGWEPETVYELCLLPQSISSACISLV